MSRAFFFDRFKLFRKSESKRQIRNQIRRVWRRCRIEILEKRELLFAANWTNVLQPLDVTGDDHPDVSPLDVLAVINEINDPFYAIPHSQSLPTVVPDESKRPFLDVDCDQFVSPLDALIIINAINSGIYDPSWEFDTNGGSSGHAGRVVPAACSPKLIEGDSFRTELSAKVVVPSTPSAIKLQFDSPAFDTRSQGLIRDAFEIALLDANGNSIVAPIITRGNAIYNATEGIDSLSATGITTNQNEVLIGLNGIQAGTSAHVVVRLINNDGDETSQVRIKRVQLVASDLKANLIMPSSFGDPVGSSAPLLGPSLPSTAPPLPPDPNPSPDAPVIKLVTLPASLTFGTRLALSGNVSVKSSPAGQPVNRIQSIFINEHPVEILDAAGNFFDTTSVQAGQNRFTITAIDAAGRSASKTVALMGVDSATLQSDLSRYDDVSASFASLYGRTQFGDAADLLTVELASKNDGTFSIDAPLLVTVANISDPTVKLRNADGITPQGNPYVNYTNGISGKSLSPSAATDSKTIEFYNPNHVQFKYELGFFSKINSAPVIGTSPLIEALVGKTYSYSLNATDENGDTLSYRLNEAPRGMTIDSKTGKITWTTLASDLGNHNIVIAVNDGRGGTTTQRFTLAVTEILPNRPPVFTSTPVVDGYFGSQYVYDAKANDADGDTLSFQLVDAAPGVQVDSSSGRVTWAQAGVWTWDAVKDFSPQTNPSKEWSYGWSDTAPGSILHVYPNPISSGGNNGWNDPNFIFANVPDVGLLASGLLLSHPGTDGQWSVVRWTAPQAGSVEVAAMFDPIDRIATTDVHVLHNGRSIFDGVINGTPSHAELPSTIDNVAAGDTIDFVVGSGTNGWAFDNTSVAGTIKMLRPSSSPVTLSVMDGHGGSATQTFNIDVHQSPGNHDPRIVSSPRVSSPYGEAYADTVVAIDPDADQLTYSLPAGPVGMTIDTKSGVLSWPSIVERDRTPGPAPTNGLTLSSEAIAAGFVLTEFVRNIPAASGAGPLGIAFPSSGGVLVSNHSGEVRRFSKDVDGLDASNVTPSQRYGFGRAFDMAKIGNSIYMSQRDNGAVVQINDDGTLNQSIVGGLASPHGVVVNPVNEHLIVSSVANVVYDVDPIAKTSRVLFNASLDGISINADGSILYGAGLDGHIYGYSLLTGNVGNVVFDSGFVPGGPDGAAVGGGALAGKIFVNTNQATIIQIDLQTKQQTIIASGGTRGDFARIDPTNGTLLLTQLNSIVRLRLPNDSSFTATTNGLKLTAEAISAGFELTEFARKFPVVDTIGPLGITFPSHGGVLVSDYGGNIRQFANDSDGQDASTITPAQNYGLSGAVDIARVGSSLYMTQRLSSNSGVVQINDNGTFNQIIVTGLQEPTGIVANPANGHLIVSSLGSSVVYDVDPIAKTTMVIFNAALDGITIAADGSILYGAGIHGHIYGYSLLAGNVGNVVFDSGNFPGDPDGLALGGGALEGKLFANTNQGTIIAIDLTTKQQTVIATGGTRGDFAKIDPTNGTLLLTQRDTIARLRLPAGSSFLTDFDVKVKVEDGKGGSDTQDFRLHLNSVTRGEIQGQTLRDPAPLSHVSTTLTVDNRFALFHGTGNGSSLSFVGQDDDDYGTPESFSFNTNAGEFVYVVAWDIDGYNMFIGDFLINDSQRVFTNKTDWEYVIGSGVSPRASFDPPPLSTLQSDIARGGWTLPTTSADQPSFPWTTFVPAISPKAQFIWADTFGSASTASRNSYVIFRIKTPVPAVGLPGLTVFLDQNQNGRLDSFEKSTTTDAQGNYAFKGLIPATYYVTQIPPAGLRLTNPPDGFYSLSIVGGQSLTRKDFTNAVSSVAEIHGMKFNDINGDGIRPIDNPTSNTTVAGTSDPWLAGMPAGSKASSGDVAPAQSPAQVNGVPIVAGSTLTFQVSGSVNYVPSPSGDPPDGNGIFVAHSDGVENGISQVIALGNSLMAVFIGADQPSLTPAPSTLDFRPLGNVVGGIDYLTLAPKLKQVFFIGDGLTLTGQKQEITVPDGATRLFLGTMDGSGWFNNFGAFSVTVNGTSLEPGLKDWTIFLDQNANGSFDTGERSTLTDVDGNYSFTNLTPGTFKVAEVSTPPTVVAGATWIQTAPATKTHQITVVAGEVRRHVDFGNHDLGAPNHSPKLTSNALTLGDVGTRYLYEAKATDDDGDRLKFDLPVKPSGMAIDPNSGIIVWTPTADQLGAQSVILRVSDGRGGVDLQSFQVTVEALNHAPVITSQPPGPAVANLPYQYRIRAQDSNGDPITFRLKSNPIGDMKVDATTGVLTWRPTINDIGAQKIDVTATDPDGDGTGQIFELTVVASAPNRSPVLNSSPVGSVRLGNNYFYAVDATDLDGDPLTYQLDVKPLGVTIDASGVITWTPSSTQFGDNQIKIRTTDGRGGEAIQSFNVSVLTQVENHAPTISSVAANAATLGVPYRYNVAAKDIDGDTLAYSLEKSPIGMSIDSFLGAVRWTPTEAQLGPQEIIVKVMDPQGATSSQSFMVTVRGSNLPPQISSVPLTTAAIGRIYSYAVRATDPEGGPLTYSLIAKSGDMSMDSSGIVKWTPTVGEIGVVTITIRVSDASGASTDQTFKIAAFSVGPNHAPVITSQPILAATVNQPYQYRVIANDPDGGPIRFAFLDVPVGMTIDENTGVINWTSSLAGIGLVTVLVSDRDGGEAEQSFEVVVRGSNLPPKITSTPITSGASGTTYRYDVHANDPNNDPLNYVLTSGPSGMSIDSLGRITWITKASDVGSQHVKLTVSDDHGASVVQEYDLVVTADTEAPKVRIQVSSNPIAISETLELLISATDNTHVKSLDVTVDGKAIALDSRGRASLLMSKAGSLQIIATATDDSGNIARQTKDVLVIDISVTGSPVVDVTVPAESATITAPTDVIGTVQDANLISWKLEVGRSDGSNLKVFATGITQVKNTKLGTFDPTLLQNDSYIIRLTALNRGGLSSSIDTTVNVSGNLKLGNFTLTFTDLSIPVAGIPITVSRTYDTLTANQDGELGFGWKLAFRDVDLRTKLVKTGDEAGGLFTPFRDGTRVYITLPGGQREGFTFRPKAVALFDQYQRERDVPPEYQPGNGLNAAYFVPSFVPDKGNSDTLSVPRFQLTKRGHDYFQFGGGLPYNPNDPAYGGRFTLTTKDGAAFQIDAGAGLLRSLTGRNGNTLNYSDDGITSSRGPKVTFARDLHGRITTATGPGNKQVLYKYDDTGNLASVTDPAGNVTQLEYLATPAHYVAKVIDPLGVSGIRIEYDSAGRISKVLDALGNASKVGFDASRLSQTMVDSLGRRTTTEYDDRGNTVTQVDAAGGITTQTFDENNNRLSVTDPLGHATRKTYDDGGKQLSVTDPLGNVSRFTYDTFGNELTATDPLGNTSQTTRDNNGIVLSGTDETGLRMKFEPDATGALSSITDFSGGVSKYIYDSAGYVTSRVDPNGNATTITHDVNGLTRTETTQVTTPNGQQLLTTSYIYDALGQVISVTDPAGAVTRTEYDAGGRVTATIDPLGRRTEFSYDERGLLLETRFANGHTTKSTYDAEGQQLSATDQSGRTTRYQYDLLGRLVTTILPDATPLDDSDNPRVKTEYDKVGNVIATVDPLGNRFEFTYDASGRQVQVRDPLGNFSKIEYDASGRQIATTNPLGFTTRHELDAAGRPNKTLWPDGTTTSIKLDSAGRVIAQTVQDGAITGFEYDILGRLTAVVDALGKRTESVYDEAGRLVKRTDAKGHVTKFEYDAAGRQITEVRPLGQRSTTVYNAAGEVIETNDFNGEKIGFQYDAVGRLISQRLPDGSMVKYVYTPSGKPSKITDSRGDTSYTYDAQDRRLSQTNPDGRMISYAYDLGGRKTAIAAPSGTTTYAYDAAGHLLTVSAPGNQSTNYTYDAYGNVVRTNFPDGSIETRSFDTLNRLLTLDTSSHGALLSSFHYTLGKTGRVDGVEEAGRSVAYAYDVLGRLTKESISDATLGARTVEYSYDSVGNRLTRTDSAIGKTTYTYNDNDQLLTATIGASDTNYTYDANGNVLMRTQGPADNANYRWDALGHLVGSDVIDATGNHRFTFAYDAFGNRVSQTVDGAETRYLIDANRSLPIVIEEYSSGGILLAYYAYGNTRISQTRGANTSVYHADRLGSVRLLTSLAGAVTDRYTFDAFGLEIFRIGSTINPYRFTGEQRDFATGLDYLRARYYEPTSGRFVSTDPFSGIPTNPITLHRYIYAGADPVNNTDPTGRFYSGTLVEIGKVTEIQGNLRAGQASRALFIKNLADEAISKFEIARLFIRLQMGFLFFALDGFPSNVTYVIVRLEDPRENLFRKLEIRSGVNQNLNWIISMNIDLATFGSRTGKLAIVLNVLHPERSNIQAGFNFLIKQIFPVPSKVSLFKFEFAVRGVVGVQRSFRLGFESTWATYHKQAFTFLDLGDTGNGAS